MVTGNGESPRKNGNEGLTPCKRHENEKQWAWHKALLRSFLFIAGVMMFRVSTPFPAIAGGDNTDESRITG